MLDQLQRLAEEGERAGLPVGPYAVRRRAQARQVRRRVLGGVVAALAIIGAAVGVWRTSSSHPTQHVNVISPVRVASADLSSLTFVDVHNGFALDGPWLARTSDEGRTWYRVGRPQLAGLTSLRFADASVGYAWVDGEVLWTGDGGVTWRAVDVPDQVFDLRSANGETQVLTGCSDGTCDESLWSLAGGTANLINHLNVRGTAGTIALNPARGAPTLVVTSDGNTDHLLSVDSQPNNVGTLHDPCPGLSTSQFIARTSATSGYDTWLVCAGSTQRTAYTIVYHSSDGGRSWALMTSTATSEQIGRAVGFFAAGEGTAWLAVDQAGVLVTGDGGQTWKVVVPSASGGPVEVTGIVNGPKLWAVADHAIWFSTSEVTWTRL